MEGPLNLSNLEGMMLQMSQDHARLEVELEKVHKERKQKTEDHETITCQEQLLNRENSNIMKEIQKERLITDEFVIVETKLREEIFGTDSNYKRSKLYLLSRLKSQLQQLKIIKEHREQRINKVEHDIKSHRQSWDKFEQGLPMFQDMEKLKIVVVELEENLKKIYSTHGNVDQIKQEVDHIKETVAFQTLENDRDQEESVNKKKEKKILEKKKQRLTQEIRSLENRSAAKKKRITATIQEFEAELKST